MIKIPINNLNYDKHINLPIMYFVYAYTYNGFAMITLTEICKLCSTIEYVILKNIVLMSFFFCIGAIQDITFSQLTSTNSIITWKPPLQYIQYGSFDGYIVMCNISNTNTIITSNITQELNVSVIFLRPFTSYICCVTPQWTTNEKGKTQCISFTTLQDGK